MTRDLDTIPKRMRWILDHKINPETGERWKGNELGRAAKIPSVAHVNMIARGEIREPKDVVINAVAAAAGVSAVWLRFGTGVPDDRDDARPPSTAESATPHLANAVGFDDALAEAKRREPRLRAHAWEAVAGAKRYMIRGIVQPEELVELARVADRLADPARMAAAMDAQAARIAELEAQLAAAQAGEPAKPKRRGKPAPKAPR